MRNLVNWVVELFSPSINTDRKPRQSKGVYISKSNEQRPAQRAVADPENFAKLQCNILADLIEAHFNHSLCREKQTLIIEHSRYMAEEIDRIGINQFNRPHLEEKLKSIVATFEIIKKDNLKTDAGNNLADIIQPIVDGIGSVLQIETVVIEKTNNIKLNKTISFTYMAAQKRLMNHQHVLI